MVTRGGRLNKIRESRQGGSGDCSDDKSVVSVQQQSDKSDVTNQNVGSSFRCDSVRDGVRSKTSSGVTDLSSTSVTSR